MRVYSWDFDRRTGYYHCSCMVFSFYTKSIYTYCDLMVLHLLMLVTVIRIALVAHCVSTMPLRLDLVGTAYELIISLLLVTD